MKRYVFYMMMVLTFTLTGCESSFLSESNKDLLISKIEKYSNYNEVTHQLHDSNLDDVEMLSFYVKENFFNYDKKKVENVELEYSTHYKAFSSLDYITNYLETIDEFNYGNYYELIDYNAMIQISNSDKVIKIDYYQYFDELNIVSRQYYVLKEIGGKLSLERYSTTVDLDSNDILLHQKLSVLEGSHIEQVEYIPKTMTYTYIYNSFEDQEYFKYNGFFDNVGEYTKETIEIYLSEFNSYVAYDIKDNELEDYRIKVFDKGHRVLKFDVNVFNKKETETELTWNLLSVNGWTHLQNKSGKYEVIQDTVQTMQDYSISLQLDGYGKINAYKMITGDLIDSDITLEEYGMTSGFTLEGLEDTKTAFINSYELEMAEHGFLVSNTVNKNYIENYFTIYLESGKLNDFMNTYR